MPPMSALAERRFRAHPDVCGGHLGPAAQVCVYGRGSGLVAAGVAVRVGGGRVGAGAEQGEDVSAYGQRGMSAAAVDAAGLQGGLQERELEEALSEPDEWQLYGLNTGELRRCPPKCDSY